jgi:hypothetical protein
MISLEYAKWYCIAKAPPDEIPDTVTLAGSTLYLPVGLEKDRACFLKHVTVF